MIHKISKTHAYHINPIIVGGPIPNIFPAKAKYLEVERVIKGLMTGGGMIDHSSNVKLVRCAIVHLPEKQQVVFKLVLQCHIKEGEIYHKHIAAAGMRLAVFLGLKDIDPGKWKDKIIKNGSFVHSTIPLVLHMQYPDGNSPENTLLGIAQNRKLPHAFPARAILSEIRSQFHYFIHDGGIVSHTPEIKLASAETEYIAELRQVIFNLILKCPAADDDETNYALIASAGNRMARFVGLKDERHSKVKGKYLDEGKTFEGTYHLALHINFPDGNDPKISKWK